MKKLIHLFSCVSVLSTVVSVSLRDIQTVDGKLSFSQNIFPFVTLDIPILDLSIEDDKVEQFKYNEDITLYAILKDDGLGTPSITIDSSIQGVPTKNQLAKITWKDAIGEQGWAYLWASFDSRQDLDQNLQAYLAGFLEGIVSARPLSTFRQTSNYGVKKPSNPCLTAYFKKKAYQLLVDFGIYSGEPTHVHANATNSSTSGDTTPSTTASSERSSRFPILVNNLQSTLGSRTGSLGDISAPTFLTPERNVNPFNKPKDTEITRQTRYVLYQLLGIRDGYNKITGGGELLKFDELFGMNYDGETDELETLLACKCAKSSNYNTWYTNTYLIDNEANWFRPYTYASHAASNTNIFSNYAASSYSENSSHPWNRHIKVAGQNTDNYFFYDDIYNERIFQSASARSCPFTGDNVSSESTTTMTIEEYRSRVSRARCSVLIKGLWEKEIFSSNYKLRDLLVGHVTWSPFREMVRIIKEYSFPFDNALSRVLRFTAYPGCISSTDDFIQTDTKLVLTETSLISNDRLDSNYCYSEDEEDSYCESRSKICWGDIINKDSRPPQFINIMTSIRMANTGKMWAIVFSNIVTPSYSTHWMIVDFNNVQYGQRELPANTLIVLENTQNNLLHYMSTADENEWVVVEDARLPSLQIQDETLSLQWKPSLFVIPDTDSAVKNLRRLFDGKSYWFSANSPWYSCTRKNLYFPVTHVEKDFTSKDLEDFNIFFPDNVSIFESQNQYPRAVLFDLFAPLVETKEEFAGLITRIEPNIDSSCSSAIDFHDPINAISSRYSEDSEGGVDAKFIGIQEMKEGTFRAKSGPSAARFCAKSLTEQNGGKGAHVTRTTTSMGYTKYKASLLNNGGGFWMNLLRRNSTEMGALRAGNGSQQRLFINTQTDQSCSPVYNNYIPDMESADVTSFPWISFKRNARSGDKRQMPLWKYNSQALENVVLAECNLQQD